MAERRENVVMNRKRDGRYMFLGCVEERFVLGYNWSWWHESSKINVYRSLEFVKFYKKFVSHHHHHMCSYLHYAKAGSSDFISVEGGGGFHNGNLKFRSPHDGEKRKCGTE